MVEQHSHSDSRMPMVRARARHCDKCREGGPLTGSHYTIALANEGIVAKFLLFLTLFLSLAHSPDRVVIVSHDPSTLAGCVRSTGGESSTLVPLSLSALAR